MDFQTDVVSLGVMETLTQAGRNMLDGFLRYCRSQQPYGLTETQNWGAIHFTRADVVSMRMERKWSAAHREIVTTIEFASGARWKRGTLSMPRATIPETVAVAVRGRLIEEVVHGAPVAGLRIRRAVQDHSAKGTTLRLACDEGRHETIPYQKKAPLPARFGPRVRRWRDGECDHEGENR